MGERAQEAAERGDPVVVMDIPLLFEARGPRAFDTVLLVYAPHDVALRRLVEQRGNERGAGPRPHGRPDADRREARAGHPNVIENTGGREELRGRVDEVWAELSEGLEVHQPEEQGQADAADGGDALGPARSRGWRRARQLRPAAAPADGRRRAGPVPREAGRSTAPRRPASRRGSPRARRWRPRANRSPNQLPATPAAMPVTMSSRRLEYEAPRVALDRSSIAAIR